MGKTYVLRTEKQNVTDANGANHGADGKFTSGGSGSSGSSRSGGASESNPPEKPVRQKGQSHTDYYWSPEYKKYLKGNDEKGVEPKFRRVGYKDFRTQ
ncbi:hypothetical protein NO1_1209 [Candidatus Termititenax aidoneus]|uniref:Uncharacterized protein n=1 Tax=Termititenax aidoneus TaxID=2218524 RepID=A0A388TB48_TERA1|nr:hypothetical protein NO1_1209 [Candidatus Termititenax aidoneus]